MFAQMLDAVVTSEQTATNCITDGRLSITYAKLRPALRAIGDYLLAHEIDSSHCLALECPNSVPSALTVLSLMERGISFCLLPQPQENQPDLKPAPRFCQYRVVIRNATSNRREDWARRPEQFLALERNADFQPLPLGVDHGPRRVYLRTSGSMGASKIVVHSHDNFVGNAHNNVKKFQLDPGDRAVIPIPLAHIYGLAGAFLPAFAAGCSIDLQSHTNHLQYLAREKSFQPNVAFLTPTLCDLLLKGFSTPRAYKVVVTSGQRMGDELFRRFDQQVGGALINMYGSSELGTTAGCDPGDPLHARLTTIGKPLQTAQLRIRQPDPHTGIGELQGQNAYSFAGYVDEAGNWLRRAAPNEWFSTGDLATVNAACEIQLVGRAQNSINRSGYLVMFSDIERIMEQMTDIAQVVVVASAEENERGQALVAFCVPPPGIALNSQQARHACFGKLPAYAIPDEVRIMASLPLLPGGKVDQQALKQQAQSLFHQPASRRPDGPIATVAEVMEALTHLMVEELDVNLAPEQIEPDIALLREGLNLDSIALVRLIALIKERFKLTFHDDELDIAELQSIRALSAWIHEQIAPQNASEQPVESEFKQENHAGQAVRNLRANASLLHLRATTFGISYADLVTANERANDPASWSAGLAPLAERYEAAAQKASAARQMESARQWWRMTVNYYHFTQMFIEAERRETYRVKCWQAYQRLAALVEPRCQRVAIPYQGMTLPGYLRIARPGAPCVILLGGFEFAKEAELHQWGAYFLERGLSVLAFDGPGQGEIAARSTMRGDFETVIAAAIDFLERRREMVDATGIGLFGVSLGGYMAMRAAALEKRVTACISLSGPFDGSTTLNLAPRNQLVTARLFGFADVEPLLDPTGPINLATAPRPITQPLLIIHGSLDHIVPTEQVALIQAWAQGTTELWTLEDSEHCCFSRAREVMPTAGDWMARQLGVGAGG